MCEGCPVGAGHDGRGEQDNRGGSDTLRSEGGGSDAEFLFVVGAGGVEGGGRVVAGHAVLGDEGGHIRVGVAVEEAVVAYAESYDDIQVSACPVQETGLEDGVAHGRTYAFTFSRNAHGGLCTALYLADDCVWFEAVGPQDTGEDTGFVDEAYAVGYTYLAGADLTGEFHDFLDTGPLAVAFKFNFRTCYHDLTVPVLIITFQGPL